MNTNPWALIREQRQEIERLHGFALQVANRLADASECLGRVAEKRKRKTLRPRAPADYGRYDEWE